MEAAALEAATEATAEDEVNAAADEEAIVLRVEPVEAAPEGGAPVMLPGGPPPIPEFALATPPSAYRLAAALTL